MTERARELIEMLTILKDNAQGANVINVDITIIGRCKKDSFDFVIDQLVSYITDQEGIQ